MNIKRIILLSVVGIASIVMAYFIANRIKQQRITTYLESHYIFNSEFPTVSANRILPTGLRLPDGGRMDDALTIFRTMPQKFAIQSVAGLDDHFRKVDAYFASLFSPLEAQRMSDVYRRFVECEISVSRTTEFRADSGDPLKLLALLYKIQQYRIKQLGKAMADALFGKEVKTREYMLRKALIIGDRKLYGNDKEEKLQQLKQAMWGDQIIPMEQERLRYDRYELTLENKGLF